MLVKIYPENPNLREIDKVVNIMRDGGLVIYPTDTVYAIGCDALNVRAVETICQLKGVNPQKSNLSIICYDLSNLSEYAKVSNAAFKLMKKNLPGAFTFILPTSSELPKIYKNRKEVGIRVPDNNIIRTLVRELGNPILTMSLHDKDEIIEYSTDPELIEEKYENLVDIVIDGGSADGSLEVIERHAADITRWVSEPDRGIYDAMNKGVAMATGDYCIFMNAGDTFVAPDTVNTVVAGMERGDDVVYGDIVKNGVLKPSLSPRTCHQSAFTSTACLLASPLDAPPRYSADFKQAKQLILAGKRFRHLPVAVAHFDTHGVSNTQRSKGLWDNVKVVCETDSFIDKCRFLPHLLWPWLMCKLRGK